MKARRGMRRLHRVMRGSHLTLLAVTGCLVKSIEGFTVTSFPSTRFAKGGRIRRHDGDNARAPFLPLPSDLQVLPFRDAEVTEQLVGGVRYSMIPIPSDMMSSTLFVSNLDEFVYDDELSSVFNGMPACVVRRPDMTSLRYGFVAFRTSEEAAAALIRTSGLEWRGKRLDVQEIRRDLVVRVPERLVAYVKGVKAVRRILNGERLSPASVPALKPKKSKAKPSKSWSPPKPNSSSSEQKLYRHLKPDQQAELGRALAKGFLVLDSPKHNLRLVDIHRRCCDARGKPQVMVVKCSRGAQMLDRVLVDLSPLRLEGVFDDPGLFLVKWKADIFAAAVAAGTELLDDFDQESCELECATNLESINVSQGNDDGWTCAYSVTIDSVGSYATKPISKLPPLSVGIFVGERPQAKAMAKELAEMWDLADPAIKEQRAEERGKRLGKAPRRLKRGGGNHQAFW